MLAMEPPGNVAADIASFRRGLFADTGEPSCLAFPEVLALSFARLENAKRPPMGGAALRVLREAWEDIPGAFSAGELSMSRGLLYLGLMGPVEALASRAEAALGKLGLAAFPNAPLDAGRGFFLFRSVLPEIPPSALAAPPDPAFLDCSLVLLSIRFGTDPFAASTWSELARAKRLTGPSPIPSRREPRSL